MKKKILLATKPMLMAVLFAGLFGCHSPNYENLKYKKGDIVYLKPDSAKGVITEIDIVQTDYKVTISHEGGFLQTTNFMLMRLEFMVSECIGCTAKSIGINGGALAKNLCFHQNNSAKVF